MQGAGTRLHVPKQRELSLRFKGTLPRLVLTGTDVRGKGLISIGVELVHDVSGEVVDSGPEAYAYGEIVALKGDDGDAVWTSEEFNSNIVRETETGKPLLAGNLSFKLDGGSGVVGTFKFRQYSAWTEPGKFMLGARVVDEFPGVNIKEAKTEPFSIKDRRKTD